MVSRRINLVGLINARTLEGMVNKEGLKIKQNAFIRCEALAKGTKDDIKKLYEDYNLRLSLDLRDPPEMERKPDPKYKDLRVVENSVMPFGVVGISHDEESEKKLADFHTLKTGLQAKEHMKNYYKFLSTNPYSKQQFRKFMEYILNNEDGCICYHCSFGKDRAGVATILLLLCLDFDEDTIIEDYMFSNYCYFYDEVNKQKTVRDFTDWAFKEYYDSYVEGMFETSGSISNFLLEVIGIGEKEKEILKNKYMEK